MANFAAYSAPGILKEKKILPSGGAFVEWIETTKPTDARRIWYCGASPDRQGQPIKFHPKTRVIRADKADKISVKAASVVLEISRCFAFWNTPESILGQTEITAAQFEVDALVGAQARLAENGIWAQAFGNLLIRTAGNWALFFVLDTEDMLFDELLPQTEKRVRTWMVGRKPTDQVGVQRSLRAPVT